MRRQGQPNQMAEVVELMPPGQVLPRLLGRRRVLEEGVQTAVLSLHAFEEFDHLVEELPHALVRAARADLVRQILERLVQVGVEERVAPAIGRGFLGQETAQVVQISGGAQLLDGVRNRRLPVPVLPLPEQAARKARGSDWENGARSGPHSSCHIA